MCRGGEVVGRIAREPINPAAQRRTPLEARQAQPQLLGDDGEHLLAVAAVAQSCAQKRQQLRAVMIDELRGSARMITRLAGANTPMPEPSLIW